MNLTLYKQMIKVNLRGMLGYALGSAFYMLLMVWVYPSIAQNTESIEDLMKALPAGFSKAFGVEGGFGSFEAYISGKYYEALLTIILTIFCVMLPTKLIAKSVDQGSMAYLLSTPVAREKIAVTQALVFLSGLLLIMLMTTLAGIVGFHVLIDDEVPFQMQRFLQINLNAFFLFFAIGGIAFLVSASMNDEKKALGISGLISLGFYSFDLIAKISERLEVLKYFTLYTLYQPSKIIAGKVEVMQNVLLLFFLGAASIATGVLVFKKRDLPL